MSKRSRIAKQGNKVRSSITSYIANKKLWNYHLPVSIGYHMCLLKFKAIQLESHSVQLSLKINMPKYTYKIKCLLDRHG